jgi:di/tricarboxylate transporter
MAPISVGIAMSMGVNMDPFLMAVAVGASCAFLTPIGHQCNALILGPGGYRFSDYWRMGLPLEIFIVATGTPLDPALLAPMRMDKRNGKNLQGWGIRWTSYWMV